MYTVAFHPDGIHLLSGSNDGIRRWRLADGKEVGKQTGMTVMAISVSRDQKWMVCGTDGSGASVWDGDMHEKVVDVEGTNVVIAVDVSLDLTRFATGTFKDASVWSILNGERLVGPLKHDGLEITGIQFSPDDKQIATACSRNCVCHSDEQAGRVRQHTGREQKFDMSLIKHQQCSLHSSCRRHIRLDPLP